MHPRDILETLALVLGAIALVVLGAWLDRGTDPDLVAAIEAHEQQQQMLRIRDAWLAGLQEGEDRALFRQQRALAQQEQRP